jgi:hypothetical protein
MDFSHKLVGVRRAGRRAELLGAARMARRETDKERAVEARPPSLNSIASAGSKRDPALLFKEQLPF